MADTLKTFKKEVEAAIEKGEKKELAIMHTLQRYIVESKNVLFEGDGYSDEWQEEAARRGLPNLKTTPVALEAMVTEKAANLFKNNGVYSHTELEARYEIELEKYIKKVQIEARVMGDLALNHILPVAINYQNILITNVKGLKETGLPEAAYASQLAILKEVSEHIQAVYNNVDAMVEARKVANNLPHSKDKALAYCEDVKAPFFDVIRYHVDKLEHLVADSEWRLPKYREMLFLR
jgi:glutamine synthetase